MKLTIPGALVLALMTQSACERHGSAYPLEPAPLQLVIHGILVAGDPVQEVIVEYTRSLADGYYRGITPASGSRVSVESESGALYAFTEDASRPGVYAAPFAPLPGARYTLRVVGPAGEVAWGTTRVPEPPRLVAPATDTLVQRGQQFRMVWTAAAHAASYAVVHLDPKSLQTTTSKLTNDTSYITSVGYFGGTFGGGGHVIGVTAIDPNVLDHLTRSWSDRPPAVGSKITGGWGVFGSASSSERRLVEFTQ
jgi:hypothetical protein